MQSWSSNGQNGADDQWQSSYGFAGQNGTFDHAAWSQPIGDQAAYSHVNSQDAPTSSFFDSPHQGTAFLSGNLHGSPSAQSAFHAGHDTLGLNQQFSQAAQDVIDPTFSDIHPELYGQQGKIDLGEPMNHLGNVQSSAHPQNFPYSFGTQGEQSYDSPIQHYAQPQVIPQQNRQQSHTPVQQFEGLQSPFAHGHGYSRPPQQSPVQSQQTYSQSSFQPPVNGQSAQFQANAQPSYQQQQSPPSQQQQQQSQQHQAYPSPSFITQKSLNYAPSAQGGVNQTYQQPVQQSTTFAPTSTSPSPAANVPFSTHSKPHSLEAATPQPMAVEPPAKKRKRAVKTADAPTPEPVVPRIDSPVDFAIKKVEEIDAIPPPTPSPEEAELITLFNKRTKAAQAKQPAIKGLPFLLYDPSTKLPAPKSYDKLAPLVALPSRSGKVIVPEFGYNLPCELQGRFTSQYRPSPDKGGLDERRIEAKVLLDEFDRSMKGLGKRRPKYTEYPHAFKEQLKSDEASKNKAEKKAKKELEEERNKPVRPATRPSDPIEAAVWDITGIVHIQSGTARTNALIATRVQQAGEYVIKLRGEMNRSKQELDQAIKDKEPEAEIAKLRQEANQKKEALYRSLDAMLEHADDAVLDNLGGHQKLVLSLVNALIMCIKSSDFSGKLPKIVLELFTHFPMTRRIAETTNFETVRKRFADKGDDDVKAFVHDISSKIKKVLKGSESDSTGYTGTSAASRAKASTKSSADHSTKRSRDDDSDSRTVKKIAVELTGSSLSKKLAHPKLQLQSASKTTAAKAAANSILPGKSRPVPKSVPKPDPAKSDNKSGGDEKTKLDTKNNHTKTEPNKASSRPETKVPLPKQVGASTSSALSGIASLLDSINAPKPESPASTPMDAKASESSETPEEKAKRLRKEARRKLRVTWKPDAELEQVKIFQKEEDEDEGRDSNLTRDAADDRSEGMVLKQRANVDDEEDDDDVPYQPWLEPTPTDFSNLRDDIRNKNFVTRGGNVAFSTDEQRRIAELEQRELMAIYTDVNDIPPTPKSPPPEMAVDTDSKTSHLPTDDSKFQEVQLRWRDEQQMGLDGALYAATKRLEAKENPSNKLDTILGRLKGTSSPSQPSQPVVSAVQRPSASGQMTIPLIAGRAVQGQVLDLLGSDKAKNWQDPNPSRTDVWRAFNYTDPNVHMCGNAVEIVARSLAGKPFPAITPPDWIKHDGEKVREWQMGYNKEVAVKQRKAEEERARAEAEANALLAAAAQTTAAQPAGNAQDQWAAYYAQQQAYAPYLALLQQMNGGQPQAQQHAATAPAQPQIPDNQLQSILAAINQPAQQSAPQTAQSVPANHHSYLNPNDNSYQQYMMLQQLAQGQQPPPPPPPPAAERDWDRGDDHQSRRDEQRDRDRDSKEGRRKRGTLPPHKPANKALIGTKPCTFWQQGKCARGDKCTFRHD